MALQWDWQKKMGTLTIEQNQDGKKARFKINIYDGNCMAIMLSMRKKDGKDWYQLYSFFADEQHCKNIFKEHKKLFWDKVVKIELNTAYKNAERLAKILVKCGYTVTIYNKEIK